MDKRRKLRTASPSFVGKFAFRVPVPPDKGPSAPQRREQCTVPLFTSELPLNDMVKISHDPKWQPKMHEHPAGIGCKHHLSEPYVHQNEHCEPGGRNVDESNTKDHTPMDMIQTNRNVFKSVKPQMTKLTEEIIETTFRKIVTDLNYSFSTFKDASDGCFTFVREHQSNEDVPQVKSPSEMTEKGCISNLEVSCVAKDLTENIFHKLDSAVVDTCTASTSQKDQLIEHKAAFETSRNELAYKQPKEIFNVSLTQPSMAFVSGIAKEIIHTISNKLEAFAISGPAFLNTTEMAGIRHLQTEMVTEKLGVTRTSIFRQSSDVNSSTAIGPPDDQRDVLCKLNVREERKPNMLQMNHSGFNLFSCIGDILKSLLESILKELDQVNSLNTSKQKTFQCQERAVLHGLVTNILNDLNGLGCKDIFEALKSGAAEYCFIDRKSEPKVISPQQSTIEHGIRKEYPPIDFTQTVMYRESDLEEESEMSIDMSSSAESEMPHSSENEASLQSASCENTLLDVEVLARKNKMCLIIKAAECVVNDTLASIMADKEFPYSSYFCSDDWEIALMFVPESQAKHPFAGYDVLLFVLDNVESIIKLLSLAFDDNILSHAIAFPGIHNEPFMGLCADIKMYKQGMVAKIHEVPKAYVSQLMSIISKQGIEQGTETLSLDIKASNSVCPLESVTQSTTLDEIYELFVNMILTELKQFLDLKCISNFESYPENNISINETQSSKTSKTITLRTPLQCKLYIFAKNIANTILNAIKNTGLEENQTKDSSVIISTDENNAVIMICNLILGTSSAKIDYIRNDDAVKKYSEKQPHKSVKGKLQQCASLAPIASFNMEQDEKERRHASEYTSEIQNMSESSVFHISDDESSDTVPHPHLARVSTLSEQDAIVCVNKMRPIVETANVFVANTLAKIMADAECVSFMNNNSAEGHMIYTSELPLKTNHVFPASSVMLFAIDITESMLKMLSVAFEQAGLFHDTIHGLFMGLCADLWLLKEEIGCLTTFVEVDVSFVEILKQKNHKQDCLESVTPSAIMNTIGQHLIHVMAMKFVSFIQLHCKSDSEHEDCQKTCAVELPLNTTSLFKLYPYAREISQNILYVIITIIDEEQQNSVSGVSIQAEQSRFIESICHLINGSSSAEVGDMKVDGAIEIQSSSEAHKMVNKKDHVCVNVSETFVSSSCKQDEKDINQCAAKSPLQKYSANQRYIYPNPVLKEIKDISEFVLGNVLKKIEDECNAPQRSQIIKIVKEIVTDIFKNYFMDLFLPLIYNNSSEVSKYYKQYVTEAFLNRNNKTAGTLVSSTEIVFLAHDVIKNIFRKLHSAFLCNMKENNTHCLEEYKLPVHDTIITEQTNKLFEQSSKEGTQPVINTLFVKETSDKMANNSVTNSSLPTNDLMDDVFDSVISKIEMFAKSKVESIFHHTTLNTNMSAKTSAFSRVQQCPDLMSMQYQTNDPNPFVEEVVKCAVPLSIFYNNTPAEKETMSCHLSHTQLFEHAKEAASSIFKGIKREIHNIPSCSVSSKENVAGEIVDLILDSLQYNGIDKDELCLKSHIQQDLFLGNDLSKAPVFREELELQTGNTVEHVLNEIFQRQMYDIENTAYYNTDHLEQNAYHISESHGSESNKQVADRVKSSSLISKSDVKFVSRDMVDIVLGNLLCPTMVCTDSSRPNSSKIPDLLNVAAENMITNVATRLKSVTALPRDSKFISAFQKKKGKGSVDFLNKNQDFEELLATQQLPSDMKMLPASYNASHSEGELRRITTNIYKPARKEGDSLSTTDPESHFNVHSRTIVSSILKSIRNGMDHEIQHRDSSQSILYEQSIASKNIVNNILEIVSSEKNSSCGNVSMIGFCKKITVQQQPGERMHVNKNTYLIALPTILNEKGASANCNNVASQIHSSLELNDNLVSDTSTTNSPCSASSYQQKISQTILKSVFRREKYTEESSTCLKMVQDVLHQLIDRIIRDLGTLALSLPYFIKRTMHDMPYSSVTQLGIMSCINMLILESKSEVRLVANVIIETVLEKVFADILLNVQQEEASQVEMQIPHSTNFDLKSSDLVDGQNENAYFIAKNKPYLRTGSSKVLPQKENGHISSSTVTRELVQHVGDRFESFVRSRLQQISVSEPDFKYGAINELTSFGKRNSKIKETVLPKINISNPLLIFPSFTSTKDSEILLSQIYVSKSVLELYAKYVLHEVFQLIQNELKLETYQRTALLGDMLPLANINTATNTVESLLADLHYKPKQTDVSPIDQLTLPRHPSCGATCTPLVHKAKSTTEKPLTVLNDVNIFSKRANENARMPPQSRNISWKPQNATNLKADRKPKSTQKLIEKRHIFKETAIHEETMHYFQDFSNTSFVPKSVLKTLDERKTKDPLLQYFEQKAEKLDSETSTEMAASAENLIAFKMKGKPQTYKTDIVVNSLEGIKGKEEAMMLKSSKLDTFIKPEVSSCALGRISVKTPSGIPDNVSQLQADSDTSSKDRAPMKNAVPNSHNNSRQQNTSTHNQFDGMNNVFSKYGTVAVSDKTQSVQITDEYQQRQLELGTLANTTFLPENRCMCTPTTKHAFNNLHSQREMSHTLKKHSHPVEVKLSVQNSTHKNQCSTGKKDTSLKTNVIHQYPCLKYVPNTYSQADPIYGNIANIISVSSRHTACGLESKLLEVMIPQVSNVVSHSFLPSELKSSIIKPKESEKAILKICTEKSTADVKNVTEIVDYQVQSSHSLELPHPHYIALEANNIVQKLQHDVKKIRDQDTPCSSLTTKLSSEFIEDIVIRLISKLFTANGNKCKENQSLVSDSEFKDMISKLLCDVTSEISNHDIKDTWSETYVRCSQKDISNVVDLIYNKMLMKYGTQLAAQDKIRTGSKSAVRGIARYLIKCVRKNSFMNELKPEIGKVALKGLKTKQELLDGAVAHDVEHPHTDLAADHSIEGDRKGASCLMDSNNELQLEKQHPSDGPSMKNKRTSIARMKKFINRHFNFKGRHTTKTMDSEKEDRDHPGTDEEQGGAVSHFTKCNSGLKSDNSRQHDILGPHSLKYSNQSKETIPRGLKSNAASPNSEGQMLLNTNSGSFVQDSVKKTEMPNTCDPTTEETKSTQQIPQGLADYSASVSPAEKLPLSTRASLAKLVFRKKALRIPTEDEKKEGVPSTTKM